MLVRLRILVRFRVLSSDRRWVAFQDLGSISLSFLLLASSFIVKTPPPALSPACFLSLFPPPGPPFLINPNSSDPSTCWKQDSCSCQMGMGRCHILDFYKRSHCASGFPCPGEGEQELSGRASLGTKQRHSPGQVAQLSGVSSRASKSCGFNPGWGTYLGCGFDS